MSSANEGKPASVRAEARPDDHRSGNRAEPISNRLIARNTGWNLFGQAVPMLAAIVSIPIIIRVLAVERFGVLNITWVVISYFAVFDFGLGRALTQIVAEKTSRGLEASIPLFVWTAIIVLTFLGLACTAVSFLLSPLLVHRVLVIPPALQQETLRSFYVLGFSIPAIISAAAWRGVLEARQRFDLINAVRIPSGVFILICPLFVLPFSSSLVAIAAIMVVGQVMSWLGYFVLCLKAMPALRVRPAFRKDILPPLLRLGGWMTISNIISPLMVYLDRFFIGALISLSAVSYYATPFEVVTKLWLFPGAMVRVLFPAFTDSHIRSRERTMELFNGASRLLYAVLFPAVLLIVAFGREGLGLWLGAEFARNSTLVLQILSIGVLVNSLAQIPFAFVQAVGRPDLTSKLNLVELPFYLLLLWGFTRMWGIAGTAAAWVLRMLVDLGVLLAFSRSVQPQLGPSVRRGVLHLGLGLAVLLSGVWLRPLALRIGFVLVVLSAFGWFSWRYLIGPEPFRKALAKAGTLVFGRRRTT